MSADPGAVIVFAGPSLHGAGPSTLAPFAGCTFWPPAGRGDVLRALAHRPRTLVLIDGYFHRVPAVTHQELLYALDSGVPVYGAASMGALRAAELAAFGMRGVGRIFAAYEAAVLDGDDEVALLHAPAEYGYAPIGVALVEVRFALARRVAAGSLDAGRAAAAIAALKRLSFEERTGAALVAAGVPAAVLGDIAAGSVKRADALAAIAAAVGTGDLADRSWRCAPSAGPEEVTDFGAGVSTQGDPRPRDTPPEWDRRTMRASGLAGAGEAGGVDEQRALHGGHVAATALAGGMSAAAPGDRAMGSTAGPAFTLERAAAGEAASRAELAGGHARPSPRSHGRRMPRPATGYLRCFKELYLPAPGAASGDVTLAQALHAFLVLHPDAEAWVRAARDEAFRAACAALAGAEPSPAAIADRAAALRALHAVGAAGMAREARLLPEAEYAAEARVCLLAEDATAIDGAPAMWRRFGGALGDGERPWRLFEAQPELLSSWDLARRFAFTPALAAAARTARAAAEVLVCWRRAHRDARIEPRALYELAARLWQCPLIEVGAVGIRRGLFSAAGLTSGLRDALELVAPGEHLTAAINDYPTARAELVSVERMGRSVRAPFDRPVTKGSADTDAVDGAGLRGHEH